jgi:hypothetical protein
VTLSTSAEQRVPAPPGRLALCVDTALSVAQYVLHNEVDVAYGGAPFGEGGALHHIGTRGGRAAWSNPHDAGLVLASTSSVGRYNYELASGTRHPVNSHPCKLVGRAADGLNFTVDVANTEDAVNSWVADAQGIRRPRHSWVPNSWVAVDLGSQRTMRVAHYCLRHGWDGAYYELRSWELQARAGEADAWTTLRRHDADASLQGGDSVAAFEVTQHTGTAFRHFRLHQHGPNANGPDADGGYRLVCGGLELYGTLLDGAAYE